jgi:serine/threonine protein kinase
VLSKLGEGTFGEAYKVRSRSDGRIYAVKKAKESYMGYKDRESKLAEVYKALKLTGRKSDFQKVSPEIKSYEGTEDDEYHELYRSHCV